MVLDGLDEIGDENQSKALDKLSEAAREDRHFVVTCRTSDYARIVGESVYGPLAKTPVIAMGPLPLPDVIQYLRDTVIADPPERWNHFLNHLKAGPGSALGKALSTSLAVWLVRTYYRRPQNRPSDLLDLENEHEITALLLDGLVEAVYSIRIAKHPAQAQEKVRTQRERLSQIAEFLSSRKGQNIEWWHLPEIPPRPFIGGTVGVIVGCVVGVCVGLSGAIRLGARDGVLLGIAFFLISGVISGVTSVRWQEDPRTVDIFRWSFQRFAGCLAVGIVVGVAFGFSADRGGGLVVGLVTVALIGPIGAVVTIPAFGRAPGITTGITGALAIGLACGLASRSATPVVSGIIAGAVFMASVWIFIGLYRPSRSAVAASPESLLRQDRNGCIIVGLTAGIAFGVLYGFALGSPLIGLFAVIGLTIPVCLTVSMWGVFNLTRLWLAMFRKMPLDIMSFLQEAYDRGVLRRLGGAYQFRHDALQRQLSQHASTLGGPTGRSTLGRIESEQAR